jgi:hypothetical protein
MGCIRYDQILSVYYQILSIYIYHYNYQYISLKWAQSISDFQPLHPTHWGTSCCCAKNWRRPYRPTCLAGDACPFGNLQKRSLFCGAMWGAGGLLRGCWGCARNFQRIFRREKIAWSKNPSVYASNLLYDYPIYLRLMAENIILL